MISKQFYTPENAAQVYLGGRVPHFLHKKRTVTLRSRPQTLEHGKTLFDVAVQTFGDENEEYWSILADAQPVRYPDEWGVGDVLNIPRLILTDLPPVLPVYGSASTTTTPIPT